MNYQHRRSRCGSIASSLLSSRSVTLVRLVDAWPAIVRAEMETVRHVSHCPVAGPGSDRPIFRHSPPPPAAGPSSNAWGSIAPPTCKPSDHASQTLLTLWLEAVVSTALEEIRKLRVPTRQRFVGCGLVALGGCGYALERLSLGGMEGSTSAPALHQQGGLGEGTCSNPSKSRPVSSCLGCLSICSYFLSLGNNTHGVCRSSGRFVRDRQPLNSACLTVNNKICHLPRPV